MIHVFLIHATAPTEIYTLSLHDALPIYHGISMDDYQFQKQKQPYLSFIGRFAPVKGPHIAIEVAKKLGIPLRMAGEVQPQFKDYFENEVKPHIDGKFVEFIGEADQQIKNELLGNSMP